MIAAGLAAQVNTDLVPNYTKVYDFLKDQPWNTVDGKNYGVPHGYGANLLQYGFSQVCPLGWILGKLGVPASCPR